ncbi:hypothetical protein [Pseudonocardia thermophila]|jgi:Uncharacterized conserved protein, contains double-stranded beta-helix domain|uniref:hypothetical protein n=1 Tax=Pseudonocardia thermophila TaxID=1848 RepID=UPI00248E7363|nr:hypothetical protein [Pseudonocardia thermophila]
MRRVVVGTRADGTSCVASDGPPALVFRFPDQASPHEVRAERVAAVPDDLGPGQGALVEVFMSETLDLDDAGRDLTSLRDSWAVECPPGATRYRCSVFSPGRRTAMHRTATLDYDVVLSGSMTLILGDGSRTELAPGDAVVIPGLDHAWEAGPEGCVLSVVMIGMNGGAR